ncbi:hypothetical protein PHLGIDRAFT_312217 [Phlebiopsis gigantea 11061_1 CR5-6]|uniref:rRNA-processing protein FYV7 n=1 Tax=Phlebiopsis gigantea (strain 11061_1 CR5-6) TaxID=745531 RepID=A0A0C3SAY1_PHLG1|nr:hypothetical protein PHLGIDRAFT_312217 [Phlebiopsis gigantea 11061_1 CR5-6]
MASTATSAAKKRKPPTFHHLPTNRAKKLKRSWVEVQKIKSQWKSQKRKEGLVQGRPAVEDGARQNTSDDEGSEIDEPVSESGKGQDSSSEDGESVDEGVDEQGSDTRIEGREQPQARAGSKQKGKMVERRKSSPGVRQKGSNKRRREQKQNDDQPQLSLRELNAVAYSRSSLHTFKAKQLHRPQDRPQEWQGRGRGGGAGRGAGRGAPPGRGRGQPDMRLRMNAMLEKIKQDFP